MLFNSLINSDIWKEVMYQDKYKEMKLKLKQKYSKSARSANITNFV